MRRPYAKVLLRFIIPPVILAGAFLSQILNYSLARGSTVGVFLATGLGWAAAMAFIMVIIHGLVVKVGLFPFLAAVAVFLLAAVGYFLIPSLRERVVRSEPQLTDLARRIAGGDHLVWPRREGPFQFFDGQLEDGVVRLSTGDNSDQSLYWSGQGKTPVVKFARTTRVTNNWFLVESDD